MSMKLCCCLCCSTCIEEYQYLQNDSGESNEIYEITVKYFDPMLVTEHINSVCSKGTSLLCQNCWTHIQDFHNFQQTVINARTSLQHITIQNSILGTKEEQVTKNFSNEEVLHKNFLRDENYYGGDFDMLDDTDDDDDKPLNKLKQTLKSSQEIADKMENNKANISNKKGKLQCRKVRKPKASFKEDNNISIDDDKDKNIFETKTKNFNKELSTNAVVHPALDKGREYDKFIAEWKSQLECDICSEVFPIFDLLKVHFKKQHNTRGFVKCCDRKFDRRCSLVEHIRMHINPEMHKCDICGKISGSKYSLIHHKKTIHEESQKFKCNECPKVFKQKQNLKCHLLTHAKGNRDFKCQECDKAYVLELQLKKHIKLVHIDNRICDQCGKTLHGIGALKNHLKEHDDIVKPKHPCDECGAELGSRITLKRHKASYHNDGSTVYICGLCGKVSSTERALKNHEKFVHEIERKHKCPHCEKAFKRHQHLQEHIATHTGESLYQCPQCPRSFKISSKYHEHRKKAHPIEWEAGRKNRLKTKNQLRTGYKSSCYLSCVDINKLCIIINKYVTGYC